MTHSPCHTSPHAVEFPIPNAYLSETERAEAVQLSLALRTLARDALAATGSMPDKREALEAQALRTLAMCGWKPDYLTVR